MLKSIDQTKSIAHLYYFHTISISMEIAIGNDFHTINFQRRFMLFGHSKDFEKKFQCYRQKAVGKSAHQ